VERSCAGPIHLFLIDVILRGMNGKALAEKLIALRPNAKVLYTSGGADDTLLSLGTNGSVLMKPYTRQALLEKVRESLDRK
jgi:FixJ family two-component response regulator